MKVKENKKLVALGKEASKNSSFVVSWPANSIKLGTVINVKMSGNYSTANVVVPNMTEFSRFKDLYLTQALNKKQIHQLQKEAKQWYIDNFGATFSGAGYGAPARYTWCYRAGMLSLTIATFGEYHYAFIILILHYIKWKNRQFKQGFNYGKICATSDEKLGNNNYRDANPYSEAQFYESSAWDAGYMVGVKGISWKKAQQFININKSNLKYMYEK